MATAIRLARKVGYATLNLTLFAAGAAALIGFYFLTIP